MTWSRRRTLLALLVVAAVATGVVLTVGLDEETAGKVVENLENLPTRAVTRFVPPEQGSLRSLKPKEKRALRRLSRRLDARIVWSSNRDGNHELYLLDLGELEARRLTDTPHVEFFSRFSPDGERILFLRSQREWVSFRETEAWDVYVMNADGTDERLLFRNGYHATWGPDGRSVIFQRNRKAFRYDLETGEERLLFEPSADFPGTLGDPKISADGSRLVLATLHTGIGVVDLESGQLRHFAGYQACQTDWGPGDRFIIWVGAQGNGGTRIMKGTPDGREREVLIDLPGEISHEYFPTLSDDGRWLVWGASAGGHEHDRADYEIFIWRVGTDWESAVRLTYYTGNDQWPDVHVDGDPGERGGGASPR